MTALERMPTDRLEEKYATHEGIWELAGHKIRVYRLNTGEAIINAEDMCKIFGCSMEEMQAIADPK